jgi:hypothetical protein
MWSSLRDTSRKSDPKGVFQRQVPSGFKLGIHYCHDISLLRGLVGSWLTPGGALGYKVMGRTHIYDRRIIINTVNYPHVYMLHL